jgi:glycosyltransferase involved in cell wall biosynthesis
MRILYIITKNEYGGAQTHISQLVVHMRSLGNDVAIMSQSGEYLEKKSNFQFPISNFQSSSGVKFYPNKYLKNSYNLFLGISAMKEIKKAVEEFNPDIVHCHSSAAGFWTRLALRSDSREVLQRIEKKPRVIFTAHGWGFTEGTPFLRKNLILLAEKVASRFCSKIICVSEYDRQSALKNKIAPAEKLVTIHNGVELENFNSQISISKESVKLKIVFVGRLTKPKDPKILIRAFGELPSEIRTKSEVLIVGEGNKSKEVENFIKEQRLVGKVRLLGRLAREKVFEVLRKSDIFVLTSDWEGLPYTILEAMTCGLPVIASNVGGISEMVDKDCGVLIGRGDKDGLKKALVKLISDSELRRKMGKAGRERIKKEFSLEKMLSKTKKTYMSLLR